MMHTMLSTPIVTTYSLVVVMISRIMAFWQIIRLLATGSVRENNSKRAPFVENKNAYAHRLQVDVQLTDTSCVVKETRNVQALSTDAATDVIRLIADGHVIACSRSLLCKNSDYFQAMFDSRMRESSQTDVTLHDVDVKSLRTLVSYCEGNQVSLDDVSVWPLLMMSRMLQFVAVAERCEQFVFQQLKSPDTSLCTVLSIYKRASSLLAQSLSSFAKNLLLYNFTSVRKLEEFYTLPSYDFIGIVDSDFLNLTSECEVLEAVQRYCDVNNPDSVTQRELFDCVRFDEVDIESMREELLCDVSKHLLQYLHIDRSTEEEIRHVQTHRDSSSRGFPTEALFVLQPSHAGGKLTICRFRKDENALEVVTRTPVAAGLIGYKVCSARERLYIAGGEWNQIGSECWMDDIWMYNSVYDRWHIAATLPQPRRSHVMCCDVNGDLYIAGGYGRFGEMLSSVYKLSAASGQWTELPQLPGNVSHFDALLRHDNKLLGVHGLDVYALALTLQSGWQHYYIDCPDQHWYQDPALWHLHKHLLHNDVMYLIGEKILARSATEEQRHQSYEEIVNLNVIKRPYMSILDPVVMDTRRASDGVIATTIMMAIQDRSGDCGALHVYEHSVGTDVEEASTLHENVAVPNDLLTSSDLQMAVCLSSKFISWSY